jgi:hypothetical protein
MEPRSCLDEGRHYPAASTTRVFFGVEATFRRCIEFPDRDGGGDFRRFG